MIRNGTVWLAFMVGSAIAMMVSATALAAKNPVLVKSNGEAVTNLAVTGKSLTEPMSETVGGAKISCRAATGTGNVSTTLAGDGMTSGTGTVTFTGCESAAVKCENTATSGEITGTVSTLLVWIGKESSKTIGILTSILPFSGAGRGKNALLSYKCGTAKVLVDVEGAAIGSTNRRLGEAFTQGIGIAKSSGGVQEDQAYTENGVEGSVSYFSSEGGGAFEQSAGSGETETAYGTIVKVIEA
jgi:hypothetical protein